MGDKKYKYLFYILAVIVVVMSFSWWTQYTYMSGENKGVDSVAVMIQNEINQDSTSTNMAHQREYKAKTNYHAMVVVTGDSVTVWKQPGGLWVNYMDPKITYQEIELTIGDIAE